MSAASLEPGSPSGADHEDLWVLLGGGKTGSSSCWGCSRVGRDRRGPTGCSVCTTPAPPRAPSHPPHAPPRAPPPTTAVPQPRTPPRTHGWKGPVLSTCGGCPSCRLWKWTLNQAVKPCRVPAFLMSKRSSPLRVWVKQTRHAWAPRGPGWGVPLRRRKAPRPGETSPKTRLVTLRVKELESSGWAFPRRNQLKTNAAPTRRGRPVSRRGAKWGAGRGGAAGTGPEPTRHRAAADGDSRKEP
ncbi:hypothetical protein P7K49_032327 [Saguinus oedipus]|uniref:Uncharacterized protein n=1 Tax=Saguinus oedipus TaxID=9490 RepID=A0ABQ9TYL5_SAGOE|nr:hypothetical protein P7K49_032327 [Saguinus oedipus]